MKQLDNTMNIKPPRTGVNEGSRQTSRLSGSSDAGSASGPKSTGASGDTVTITNAAAEMLKLEESLAKIPDIDNTLVVSIRASISEGSYRVDPEKIADRLMTIDKDAL